MEVETLSSLAETKCFVCSIEITFFGDADELLGPFASSMADQTQGDSSRWQPYWDETYKRYYWSDGNESVRRRPPRFSPRSLVVVFFQVWETPKGCVEPPPPDPESSDTSEAQQQQYSTSEYALSTAAYGNTASSDVRYQPYAVPPTIPSTISTGKRLVGQEARDLRQLYHYFDYNAWNEELNRTNANQKKKVKLTKKELDAIKARRAAIKKKHRDKWLLED